MLKRTKLSFFFSSILALTIQTDIKFHFMEECNQKIFLDPYIPQMTEHPVALDVIIWNTFNCKTCFKWMYRPFL